MNNDDHQHQDCDQPRHETRGGRYADSTSSSTNDDPLAADKPEQGDIERVATDVQNSGREYPSNPEQPLEAEILSRGEVRQEVMQIMTSAWAGPTPSPETLKAFNEVNATFAERAFRMSENTVETANYERKKLVDGDVEAVRRGQWMAWIISVMCVAGAILCAVKGQEIVAGVLLGMPIMQSATSLVRTIRKDDPDKSTPAIDQ